MAMELAPERVRVNAISPVFGATGLTVDFMGGSDDPEIRENLSPPSLWDAYQSRLDIANAALFLTSDEAGLVTGLCMEVDGGRCI